MIILTISFGFLEHILMFIYVTMSVTVGFLLILDCQKCAKYFRAATRNRFFTSPSLSRNFLFFSSLFFGAKIISILEASL